MLSKKQNSLYLEKYKYRYYQVIRMYIEEEKKPLTRSILIKIIFVSAGIIIGFFISRIFFQTYTISDASMNPNLKEGDKVVIFKTLEPVIGDIILFKSPTEPDRVLLKRLIAKGGDVIEIKDKRVYLNSKKVKFGWPVLMNDNRVFPEKFTNRDNLPGIKLHENQYFLIGDNLDHSFDSREFGPVNEESLIGKVLFIY